MIGEFGVLDDLGYRRANFAALVGLVMMTRIPPG
jgi:hypothetical protein